MKKILIICDAFPPYGGMRIGHFYNNLIKMGWKIEILTYHAYYNPAFSQEFNIIKEAPRLNILDVNKIKENQLPNKILRFFKPEETKEPGLTNEIVRLGAKIISENLINMILVSSAERNSLYSAANILSKQFDIPWIADVRDIEEQRNDFSNMSLREKLYMLRVKSRRQIVMRNAFAIISISVWHKNLLRKYNRNSLVIYNGYDQNIKNSLENYKSINRNFTILHLGSLLGKDVRDPSIFLKACSNLVEKGKVSSKDFTCEFIGLDAKKIFSYQKELKINSGEWLKTRKYIPHEKVFTAIGDATMLLILTNNNARGVMTTKFFEYLPSAKPIILCPADDGSLGSVIDDLELGYICDSVSNTEDYIQKVYLDWKNAVDTVVPLDQQKLKIFQREYQAKQLNEVLMKALEK